MNNNEIFYSKYKKYKEKYFLLKGGNKKCSCSCNECKNNNCKNCTMCNCKKNCKC